MSSFANLPQATQDLLMVQFEFFGKVFLLGFFLIVALLIVFYWKKRQQETPYLLVALFRTWMYFLSWIYIYFSPLFIVWLYPQQSIDKVLAATFVIFRYATLLIGLLLFINILFYSPLIIAKLGGLNIMSKNTNKILDQWLGKYKNLFRRQ